MPDEIVKGPPVFVMPKEPPPHEIGFVIDGVVRQTIFVSDYFAAILLSNPVIINVTDAKAIPIHTLWDGEKLMTDEGDELIVKPKSPFDKQPTHE